MHFWTSILRGSGNATLYELFDQFLEYQTASPSSDSQSLPISAIAAALQHFEQIAFDTAGMSPAEVHDALCRAIYEERACVSAYTQNWRGTSVTAVPDEKSVKETLQTEISQEVYPWPQIEKEPLSRFDEGRFVKSFPLQFPMGVGDLRQSCLRDDYSVAKWAQHKFRYKNGAFVASQHGHRVTWAIFNESLLEAAKQKGRAYHKSSNHNALTK